VIEVIGAGAFGFLLGWNVYYVNRYRSGEVSLAQLAALVGVIAGAAVLALFPAGTVLFGAYGIGLLVGFLAYLGTLIVIVRRAKYPWAWFLDGRRPVVPAGLEIPEEARRTRTAMGDHDHQLPS
jgi:hypothetical protein